MTRKMLQRRMLVVFCALGTLIIAFVFAEFAAELGLGAKVRGHATSLATTVLPLLAAMLVALVANWFQQRSAFVESLRRLWSHIIDAKLEVVLYAQREATYSPDAYAVAYQSLSRAIDEMRGVYRNVGETATDIGRYPFEPFHDMRRALETLRGSDHGQGARDRALGEIERAWNSLRSTFLDEFDPPAPTSPITERSSRDPRRANTPRVMTNPAENIDSADSPR